MTARKVCNRRDAIQNTTTINFIHTSVQHVFPMVPCYGRANAAHKTACNDERIEYCKQTFLIVFHHIERSGDVVCVGQYFVVCIWFAFKKNAFLNDRFVNILNATI